MKLTSGKNYKKTAFDGLIISGGTDVYPGLYGHKNKEHYSYDPSRDEMETYLFKKADKQKIPVLGICRGAQLMNVTRGGTLHADVSKAYAEANYPSHLLARIFYRKRMYIHSGTLLAKLLNRESVRVNSMHKQAVDEVGKGLVASAAENNGVVQCIEDPNHVFMLGVQFHPEYMFLNATFRQLFVALVERARA